MDDDFHTGQKKRHRLFADATDRLADNTGYVIQDVNALGLQVDTGEAFYLKSINPTVWAPSAPAGIIKTAKTSLSWSGGDGDLKLTAVSSQQNFNIGAFVTALDGMLVGVEMNVLEAFVIAGASNLLALMGHGVGQPESMFKYALGDTYYEAGGLLTGPQHIILPPPYTGLTEDEGYLPKIAAPQLLIDTNAGPNVSTATAGKAIFTIHYLPVLLPTS